MTPAKHTYTAAVYSQPSSAAAQAACKTTVLYTLSFKLSQSQGIPSMHSSIIQRIWVRLIAVLSKELTITLLHVCCVHRSPSTAVMYRFASCFANLRCKVQGNHASPQVDFSFERRFCSAGSHCLELYVSSPDSSTPASTTHPPDSKAQPAPPCMRYVRAIHACTRLLPVTSGSVCLLRGPAAELPTPCFDAEYS